MHWYSILPPLIAIIIVFWRKEVIMALLVAVISSEFLLALQGEGNSVFTTFLNSIERIVAVASSPGNTRILIFSILIGALLAYIRESGGVAATVNLLMNKGVAKSKRQVGFNYVYRRCGIYRVKLKCAYLGYFISRPVR